ncbi:MAG: phosphate ABC transporter permease subunit PstC [Deltaproteobacteria bacterium]|nr:phosphate ABC transporter permease subunit PstC [Deltaproteobacteria bacterium]
MHTLFFLCGCVSILTTLGIVLTLLFESVTFFKEVSIVDFLTDTVWTPLFTEKRFGIWPLVCGTFLTSAVALLVALPLGLIIAIYLSEFASARSRAWLKPTLEILAGIPTIVFGYFALIAVTPLLQRFIPDLSGFNALSPGIVMGVMILPMVASLSEDALYTVPRNLRDASYAMGATRLQMVFTVLVPAAMGGITAAFILAMSRAIGETMIVAIAAGQQPILTLNPLSPVETMTAFIVQISLGDTPHGTLAYRTIFAVASTLFLMTMLLNNISLRIRQRFQQAYV